MRVLYINPFSQEVSGPDESLRTLLAHLCPLGVEAHVVLPLPGPQIPRYESLGAKVHLAPLALLQRNLSWSTALLPARLLKATLLLTRLARRLNIDLIHTNMEVVLVGGFAARALQIPHILHYRGNTSDQPKFVFDALVATWTHTADRIFCISEATADLFRRRRRDAKVEVLYNPVNLKAFGTVGPGDATRAQLGGGSDHQLVGTVGRIHPRKDLETFIRAAARVSTSFPKARFVIVGAAEGPQEQRYGERLQALVNQIGLTGKLLFAGARRDIPEVMAALDVFVLTSRHEGFGRVVAEAMAAARPIVVTDEGALPELVENGRSGLTATAADDRSFADRISALLADPVGATVMAEHAARTAIQFDAATIARRVLARYQALVETRRAGSQRA